MATVPSSVLRDVEALKKQNASRDEAMTNVRKVRDGEIQSLWPDHFSERYPQSVVANFIDVVARDLAEVIAPLPSLSCSSGQMRTEADKSRAAKKNRIGEYYWRKSRLETQMFYAADQYVTYGFAILRLEPDTRFKCPRIVLDDPTGAYYRLDRDYKVKVYVKCWKESTLDLAAKFADDPAIVGAILNPNGKPAEEAELEVVHHVDDTYDTLYLPQRGGLILAQFAHKVSRCPVEVAVRPGLHMDPRGQFDDVLWVQMARAEIAQMSLEAGHKSLEAPVILPTDVVDFNVGPDAILQTDNPAGAQKMHIPVPAEAFALGQELDQELKIGARYPDARLGVAQASVITGKGIQALMGGFDTQIKSAQTFLGRMLTDGTELAFEMDEAWWPNKVETINGSYSGESYRVTYTPRIDIAGNYTCDVTYGFAAGMSPQNALVMALQARGDGLIDRDTVRRQLKSFWNVDMDQAQRDLDVQEYEDGIKQGILAALQASGQMLAQGMDQQAMLFFSLADKMIRGRQNGKPINEILMDALAEHEQQQQEEQQEALAAQAQAAGGAPGGGQDLQGVAPNGLPQGVAPGQAGLAPGGLPPIQSLVAGFTGNAASPQATLGATVRKRIPTG